MATTIDEAAVYRLFAFLNDSRNVAIHARSTEGYSNKVLQILLDRCHQYCLTQKVGSQLTFAESKVAIQAVVQGVNVSHLATDTQTPEDHVVRILRVIAGASNRNWGQLPAVNQFAFPGSNLQALFVPILRSATPSGHLQWAESIPQHSFQLRRLFDRFPIDGNSSQQTGYSISTRDFGVLKDGMTLLNLKITSAFEKILDDLPPHRRPQFAAEGWYTSLYQSHGATQRPGNYDSTASFAYMAPSMAPSMAPNMAPNMSSYLAPNMASNMTPNMTLVASHSQPHSMNQVPYFAVQGNNAQLPILSQPGPIRGPLAMPQTMPFATPGAHPLGQSLSVIHPLTSKHSLVRSPGTSPVKKKPRNAPTSGVPQSAEQPTHIDTPYMFFVLAERDNMMNDLTEEHSGLKGGVTEPELTSLLGCIWTMMTVEDQAPFEAACKKWQEQQRNETEAPTANADNQDVHDSTQADKRKELVQDIKRCRIVLNAATICRSLRKHALPNHASSNLARANTARPPNAPIYPSLASRTDLGECSPYPISTASPSLGFGSAIQPPNQALSHLGMLEQLQRNNTSEEEMMARTTRPLSFLEKMVMSPQIPWLGPPAPTDAMESGVDGERVEDN